MSRICRTLKCSCLFKRAKHFNIYETENGSGDSDRPNSNLLNPVQKLLRPLSKTHIHNLYCPREKRPEAFRSGAKESVVRLYRGQSHIFFRYAVKSHFEKEKLRRRKIQYQEFLSRDRLLVSYKYSRIFSLFFFAWLRLFNVKVQSTLAWLFQWMLELSLRIEKKFNTCMNTFTVTLWNYFCMTVGNTSLVKRKLLLNQSYLILIKH